METDLQVCAILPVLENLINHVMHNINEIEDSTNDSMLNVERETDEREDTEESKSHDAISEIIDEIEDTKRDSKSKIEHRMDEASSAEGGRKQRILLL